MKKKLYKITANWNMIGNPNLLFTSKNVVADDEKQATSKMRAFIRKQKDFEKIVTIDCTENEDFQDDRIFSASDMYDFALSIANDAMSAGFDNSKRIAGMSLEEYINSELEQESGDGSSDYQTILEEAIK